MHYPDAIHRLMPWKQLESVFLFVTSRCNSHCRTCFYHDSLNSSDDLSFEELIQLSENSPHFRKLWLSGGEPFMREGLEQIIERFHKNNGVKVINLPTNGLLPKRIDRVVAYLLERCPELEIHLNFSLDALGKTHDSIRGVPGGFRKTVDALDFIADKYGNHPKLIRNIATIITRDGYDELLQLAAYLEQKGHHTAHIFETIRGDTLDPAVKQLSVEELKRLHDRLMGFYEESAQRIFSDLHGVGRKIAKSIFLAVMQYHFTLHEENFKGPTPWGMRCVAGNTTLVVDHNGAIRSCELRPPVGRIQDYGYDLGAAHRSAEMAKEIEAVDGGYGANCWCTHSCFILSSLKFSPRGVLSLPWRLLRRRRERTGFEPLPQVDAAAIESYASANSETK